MNQRIELFCCYAHRDQSFFEELKEYLKPLQRKGLFSLQSDADILPGSNWEEEISRHLNTAQIILLLISPSFIASDYCYDREMVHAMERHFAGTICVIPIILRPVDSWKDAPFGILQALPRNGEPLTSKYWASRDDAYLEIVRGIRITVEEWTKKRQSRMISLFGYEVEGGKQSALWEHPITAPLDEKKLKVWYDSKRDFNNDEIINSTWLKVTHPQYAFLVRFLENGRLQETALSDPGRLWGGSWELIDGMLRLRIRDYELDIFANREGKFHSGIEFKQGQETPWAYHALLPYREDDAKHWEIDELPDLIDRIFDQVLSRKANQKELIIYGILLRRGESSVRDIVKMLGLSHGYMKRLSDAKTADEKLERCYKHFLGREIDAFGREYYSREIMSKGINWIINDLIDSHEYKHDKYGEDKVPQKMQ